MAPVLVKASRIGDGSSCLRGFYRLVDGTEPSIKLAALPPLLQKPGEHTGGVGEESRGDLGFSNVKPQSSAGTQ